MVRCKLDMHHTFSKAGVFACAVFTLACFSVPSTNAATPTSDQKVHVQFVDSETGYSIQPEFRLSKDGKERLVPAAEISRAGRSVVSLEQGSHFLEISTPNHKPLSGVLHADGSVSSIRILLDPIVSPPELNPESITAMHRKDATVFVGFIVDENSGEPIENVSVRSEPSGVKAKSNARGFFQLVVPLQE